jgi:hypothetical protein
MAKIEIQYMKLFPWLLVTSLKLAEFALNENSLESTMYSTTSPSFPEAPLTMGFDGQGSKHTNQT